MSALKIYSPFLGTRPASLGMRSASLGKIGHFPVMPEIENTPCIAYSRGTLACPACREMPRNAEWMPANSESMPNEYREMASGCRQIARACRMSIEKWRDYYLCKPTRKTKKMKTLLTLLLSMLTLPVFGQVEIVSKNASPYTVYRDSAGTLIEVSTHSTQHKADQSAINAAIAYPGWEVYYTRDLRVEVSVDIAGQPAPDPTPDPPTSDSGLTVYAYVATWDYNVGGHGNWGSLARAEVDWDAFDVGILFASGVDGATCTPTQPLAWNNVSPDRINAFVEDAALNGKPALMSLGGAGNSDGLIQCLNNSPGLLADNLSTYLDTWGFDGIDIDAEPTSQVQAAGLRTFAESFKTLKPNAILVAAVNGGLSAMAGASDYFDHINYMTYDLSGAWPGWYSWHNAAIFNPSGGSGVVNIPGSGTEYPNVHSILNNMVAAGIPESKAGFGISVDGYVWTGVTDPEQDAAGATRTFAPQDITILAADHGTDWKWDAAAQASYLTGSNTFVSVDNAQAIQAKIDYARQRGITSIILWKYTEYQPVVEALKNR